MLKAWIISIGNELLIGDTVNTNATWIGRFLTEQGFSVEEVRTISDGYEKIRQAIGEGLNRADLVVTTGGLGPTHDDVTKKAVADLFDADLTVDQRVLSHVKEIFRRRELKMTPSNREQALIPQGFSVLFNNKGTAPGLWLGREGSAALAILPGVPYEMQYLMESAVKPAIRKRFPDRSYQVTRYLKTAGISESQLSERVIGDLGSFLNNGIGVAYLPSPSGVTIRVSRSGADLELAKSELDPVIRHIKQRADGLIYGEGRDLTLSEVVGGLLRKRGLKIAVAESCTGGFVCNELTNIAGSSDYFPGGEVAYDNEIKAERLGVDPGTLKRYGAVSKQTALELADGAARQFRADIGVSTTGVAGPGGGSRDKPVGTVWIGFRFDEDLFALKARFTQDRLVNKERTAAVLLETVRRYLMQIEPYPYDLKPQGR